MIIDPPVSVASPNEEIVGWIKQLHEMRIEHEHNAESVGAIDRSIDEARRWLRLKERVGP